MDNKEKIAEIATVLDQTSSPVPLSKTETSNILSNIVLASNKPELVKQLELFNMNQTKKNAARIIKLEDLLDKVEDEVANRFNKRPDNMSNKEVIDYMTAISAQIDRSQKRVDIMTGDDAIPISVVGESTENNYNINLGTDLNKDNKENVVDAIKSILGLLQGNNTTIANSDNSDSVDLEIIEETDNSEED